MKRNITRVLGLVAVAAAVLFAGGAGESRAADLKGGLTAGINASSRTAVAVPDASPALNNAIGAGTAHTNTVFTRMESTTGKAAAANGAVMSHTATGVNVFGGAAHGTEINGTPVVSRTVSHTSVQAGAGADTSGVKETETQLVTTATEEGKTAITTLKTETSGMAAPSTDKQVTTQTDIRTSTATGLEANGDGINADGQTNAATGAGVQLQ